mmetsp:Transcript_60851/g.143740  ORF Transcript_60851/g.143740 Transcript_60851/m.143740 type:complete len:314 (-) Transcript_60851:16-957(-)
MELVPCVHDTPCQVWFIEYSHDGRWLASASKDRCVVIWDMMTMEARLLAMHDDSVSFLAWSPTDDRILTCGNDNTARLWEVATGKCLGVFRRHTEAVTAAAWLPDGQHFVTGGLDKFIYMWSVTSQDMVLQSWGDVRVNDLVVSSDGRRMAAVCSEKLIHVYDLEACTETCYSELDNLTSLCLSACGRYALVSVSSEEIHLWDLNIGELLQTFRGHRQGHYVIRSALGGVGQNFVISGSEDSQVYIWHRSSGRLLLTLAGHAGTVNTVAWNPANPKQIASGSDDNTIRVWSCTELGEVPGTPGLHMGTGTEST